MDEPPAADAPRYYDTSARLTAEDFEVFAAHAIANAHSTHAHAHFIYTHMHTDIGTKETSPLASLPKTLRYLNLAACVNQHMRTHKPVYSSRRKKKKRTK